MTPADTFADGRFVKPPKYAVGRVDSWPCETCDGIKSGIGVCPDCNGDPGPEYHYMAHRVVCRVGGRKLAAIDHYSEIGEEPPFRTWQKKVLYKALYEKAKEV